MAAKAHSKRRLDVVKRLESSLAMAGRRPQPPSGALINVILEYADVQQDLGGDRLILRLSVKRMRDPVIKAILGREAKRLAEVSILWDDQEGEIIRVRDDAALNDEPFGSDAAGGELDTFELTEAALAYIARHASGRQG